MIRHTTESISTHFKIVNFPLDYVPLVLVTVIVTSKGIVRLSMAISLDVHTAGMTRKNMDSSITATFSSRINYTTSSSPDTQKK